MRDAIARTERAHSRQTISHHFLCLAAELGRAVAGADGIRANARRIHAPSTDVSWIRSCSPTTEYQVGSRRQPGAAERGTAPRTHAEPQGGRRS